MYPLVVVTVQMRAVQEATSTLQGAYIDVRDQNARNCDEEMRRISTVTPQYQSRVLSLLPTT